MREIKFRAVHYDNGVLTKVYDNVAAIGYDKDFKLHNAILTNGEWVLSIIPLQYTGLKDKNGVEIYLDDVLSDEYGRKYIAVFKGDCLRCDAIKPGGKNRWISNHLEVIGNIHENPELLEVAE